MSIEDETRRAVLESLSRIAPETEPEKLDPAVDFREALDLDSMDMLRFFTLIQERTGVSVPEADYRKLRTLEGAAAYLTERRGPP